MSPCLTLLIACIVCWEGKEVTRVVREVDHEADGIDLSLLKHVSPIEWDNVVIYGQYQLNRNRIRRSKPKVKQLGL